MKYFKDTYPEFGGAFVDENGKRIYIKEVIYNDPAIIVFWSDGRKTVTKKHEDDEFNTTTGIALNVLKKIMGSDFVAKLLEDWGEAKSHERRTLHDVRVAHKKKDE